MANKLEALSRNLAHNLAALRQSRNLNQGELAKLAELPRSTVTNLESGAGNPSLTNLVRLADALQVSIEELLAAPRADCQLRKANEIPVQTYDRGRVAIGKLLPDPLPGLEIDRMELKPGGWKQGVPHLAGTHEYLTCTQGELRVYVAGDNFLVQAGDVLAFPGDQALSYRNDTQVTSICYSVVALAPRRKRR